MLELNQILNVDHDELCTYIDLTGAIQGKPLTETTSRLLFSLLQDSNHPQKITRYEGKKKDDTKAASHGEQRIVHNINGELYGLSTSIHVVDGKFYLFQRENKGNMGLQNASLGEGQNGEVYLLTHEIILDAESERAQVVKLVQPIAHKIIKKENPEPTSLSEFAQASQEETGTSLVKEVNLLNAVDPNARRLVTRTAKKTVERTYMSFYPGQQLSALMRDVEHPLSFEERLQIAQAIAQAVAAFHDKGIVHGDINPDNILIEQTETGFIAHLVDIEEPYAGKVGEVSPKRHSRVAYTSDNVFVEEKFSVLRDITAAGLVYYELLTTDGLRTRPQGWIASFTSENGKMSALSVLKPHGLYDAKALTPADIVGGNLAQRQAVTALISSMVEKPLLGRKRPNMQEVQAKLTTIQQPAARREQQQEVKAPISQSQLPLTDRKETPLTTSIDPGLNGIQEIEDGSDIDMEEGVAPVPVKEVSFQDYQKELSSYIAMGKLNDMYRLIYERVLDRLLRNNPIGAEEIGIIKANALASFDKVLPPVIQEAKAAAKEVASVQNMMQKGLDKVSTELKIRNNSPQQKNTFSAARYLKQAFESIKEGFRVLAGTSKKINPGQLHAALFSARTQVRQDTMTEAPGIKVDNRYK